MCISREGARDGPAEDGEDSRIDLPRIEDGLAMVERREER